MPTRTVLATSFMATLEVNVDNKALSDAEFREFVRNTLPIIQYETMAEIKEKQAPRDGNHEFSGS